MKTTRIPPSDWTMLGLILSLAVRTAARRWFGQLLALNRTHEEITADRRARLEGAQKSRPPTPRKKVRTGLVLAFFVAIIAWQNIYLGTRFLDGLSLEQSLQAGTVAQLIALQKQTTKTGQKRSAVRIVAAHVIASDPFITALPPAQQIPATDTMSRRWVVSGASYFRPSEFLPDALPDVNAAYPVQYERLVHFTSLAFLLVLIAIVAGGMGQPTQELGRLEADTLWLVSLPIPARVLFLSKLCEYSVKPGFWVYVLPFLTLCALTADHGWMSLPIALLACLPLALALAGVRVALDTAVRLHLKRVWRKDMQIVCSLTSTLIAFYLLYLVIIGQSAAIPGGTLLSWEDLPFAWPLRAVLTPGAGVAPWLVANALLSMVVATLAVAYSAHAVQNGFINEVGTLQGTRDTPTRVPWPILRRRKAQWAPLSIIGKDLRMLYRDRVFLFSTLLLPAFMVGMQFVFVPDLGQIISGSFRHACTLIYVLAAYMLMPSATTVLSAEGPALWIMIAAPHALLSLLQKKLMLWTGIALIYTAFAFLALLLWAPWPGSAGFADAIMVLIGIPLFAIIAAGLGAANSDPSEPDPRLRNDGSIQMSLMMIMLMHAQAVYTTAMHARLAWLMLCGVFAYALWQRLEDRLPWLLDPTDHPPRRIDLTHGALAAMAFMFLQSILAVSLSLFQIPLSLVILLAFAGAGILTALGALWLFRRNQFQEILKTTGLLPHGPWRAALLPNIRWGIAGGLLAAAIGGAYLQLLSHFPLLTSDNASAQSPTQWPLSLLIALTVLAAPLAEEFIFRGLLFRGLTATIPIRWAVPASAAVFALIHPSLSVLPVFAVGCITAVVYQRSGWLLASMLVHAIYNGVMLIAALSHQ